MSIDDDDSDEFEESGNRSGEHEEPRGDELNRAFANAIKHSRPTDYEVMRVALIGYVMAYKDPYERIHRICLEQNTSVAQVLVKGLFNGERNPPLDHARLLACALNGARMGNNAELERWLRALA